VTLRRAEKKREPRTLTAARKGGQSLNLTKRVRRYRIFNGRERDYDVTRWYGSFLSVATLSKAGKKKTSERKGRNATIARTERGVVEEGKRRYYKASCGGKKGEDPPEMNEPLCSYLKEGKGKVGLTSLGDSGELKEGQQFRWKQKGCRFVCGGGAGFFY